MKPSPLLRTSTTSTELHPKEWRTKRPKDLRWAVEISLRCRPSYRRARRTPKATSTCLPGVGRAAFVKVLDEYRLANSDLHGNNRLDSIRNIIANGGIGLVFLIPGLDETLRINGSACVTTDDLVLDLFSDEFRRPK